MSENNFTCAACQTNAVDLDANSIMIVLNEEDNICICSECVVLCSDTIEREKGRDRSE